MTKTGLKILLFALMLCLSSKVKSHPHVFVDVDMTIEFNDNGLYKLHIRFYFDDMFSENLKLGFDKNKNRVFDPDEVEELRLNAFSNLANYNYFIHFIHKEKELEFSKASDFNAIIKDGKVIYSFELDIDLPVNNSEEKYRLACYDDSYYVDALLNKENIKFLNKEGYTFSYKIEEDKSQAYYFEQLYPECIFLSVKKEL